MKKLRLKMIGIVFAFVSLHFYGYDDHSVMCFGALMNRQGGPDHSDDQ